MSSRPNGPPVQYENITQTKKNSPALRRLDLVKGPRLVEGREKVPEIAQLKKRRHGSTRSSLLVPVLLVAALCAFPFGNSSGENDVISLDVSYSIS